MAILAVVGRLNPLNVSISFASPKEQLFWFKFSSVTSVRLPALR